MTSGTTTYPNSSDCCRSSAVKRIAPRCFGSERGAALSQVPDWLLERFHHHASFELCRCWETREELRHRLVERAPLVAVDASGGICGYVMFAYGP